MPSGDALARLSLWIRPAAASPPLGRPRTTPGGRPTPPPLPIRRREQGNLVIRERVLGLRHPNTLTTRGNLQSLGDRHISVIPHLSSPCRRANSNRTQSRTRPPAC